MRSVVVGIVGVYVLVCPHLDADLRNTADKSIVHTLNNREQLDDFRSPNNIDRVAFDRSSDEFVVRTEHTRVTVEMKR